MFFPRARQAALSGALMVFFIGRPVSKDMRRNRPMRSKGWSDLSYLSQLLFKREAPPEKPDCFLLPSGSSFLAHLKAFHLSPRFPPFSASSANSNSPSKNWLSFFLCGQKIPYSGPLTFAKSNSAIVFALHHRASDQPSAPEA